MLHCTVRTLTRWISWCFIKTTVNISEPFCIFCHKRCGTYLNSTKWQDAGAWWWMETDWRSGFLDGSGNCTPRLAQRHSVNFDNLQQKMVNRRHVVETCKKLVQFDWLDPGFNSSACASLACFCIEEMLGKILIVTWKTHEQHWTVIVWFINILILCLNRLNHLKWQTSIEIAIRNGHLHVCVIMCVCVYVCMCDYVCMCVCVYVCMYVCMYIYIRKRMGINAYIYMGIYTFM